MKADDKMALIKEVHSVTDGHCWIDFDDGTSVNYTVKEDVFYNPDGPEAIFYDGGGEPIQLTMWCRSYVREHLHELNTITLASRQESVQEWLDIIEAIEDAAVRVEMTINGPHDEDWSSEPGGPGLRLLPDLEQGPFLKPF
jgi:hypothetical protein